MDSKEQIEPDNSPIREIFQESVNKITQVQFINIVKTEPNHGNRVAAVIDDADIEEIRGTLAGFDTLVIFSADVDEATVLNQKLNALMQTN